MSQPQPGRPLPDYVYRRRRVAVFGGLGLVLLLILLIWHPWASGSTKQPDAEVAIPAATNPATTAPASGSTGSTGPACVPGVVKVAALTDATNHAADQLPKLTMQVTNTGDAACSLNVGTSQQKFTITGSGGETYWLSTDCLADSSDYDLVLQPNVPVSSEPISWDRTRSNPGTCQLTSRDPVPAGGVSYSLSASVDGIASGSSTQFTLD